MAEETSTCRNGSGPPSDPPVPSSGSDNPLNTKSSRGEYRYEVTVLSLVFLILATCVIQSLAKSDIQLVRLLTLPCAIYLSFLIYQWTVYFSEGLTRRKRAFFDVKNILETYQPRRYTDMARKFQPDPPTPSIAPTAPNNDEEVPPDDAKKKAADEALEKRKRNFENWRQEHYENEYQVAVQAKKNMDSELTDKQFSALGHGMPEEELPQAAPAAVPPEDLPSTSSGPAPSEKPQQREEQQEHATGNKQEEPSTPRIQAFPHHSPPSTPEELPEEQ